MMIGSLALASTLVVLTAQGAIAAQFSISGMPFVVTAQKLDGDGFEQFATLDSMAPNSPNAGDTGGQVVVIVSAVRSGELTSLCQSIDLGGVYLKLTAGTGSRPVVVSNLVVDSDLIAGDADFTTINIGQDASTLDQVPGVTGNLGVLGLQAGHVTITNLRQNNYATTAAQFTLPDLRMTFSSDGC